MTKETETEVEQETLPVEAPASGQELKAQQSLPVELYDDERLTFAQRVALDPSIDIERLKAVIEMETASQDREAEKAFNAAFAAMQPELPAVTKGGENTHLRSTYARLEDIQAAVKPMLAKHGFSVRWSSETIDGQIYVTCHLSHAAGHSIKDTLPLPVIDQKGTNRLQQHGVTVSYGRRYTLCNVLGIQLGGEDTDGELPRAPVAPVQQIQAAPSNGRLTKQQAREMYGKMQQGLRSQRSERGINGWLNAFEDELKTLPEDWERSIRTEAQQEIEGHRTADTPTEGPF